MKKPISKGVMMKVWITKYALTQGIIELEIENESDDPNVIYFKGSHGFSSSYRGKDWHKTKEDAIKRAEEMAQKKIESLQRQIIKICDLKFE